MRSMALSPNRPTITVPVPAALGNGTKVLAAGRAFRVLPVGCRDGHAKAQRKEPKGGHADDAQRGRIGIAQVVVEARDEGEPAHERGGRIESARTEEGGDLI